MFDDVVTAAETTLASPLLLSIHSLHHNCSAVAAALTWLALLDFFLLLLLLLKGVTKV